MRKRKTNIRNTVTGDPIDFYIEIKGKNGKRRSAEPERVPWSLAAAKPTLRAEEGRSVLP